MRTLRIHSKNISSKKRGLRYESRCSTCQNDIRYEEIEKPQAAPGKVVIKVKYTGICGSDIPRVNADACHYFPNVLGHEFSGTVTEIGEGVTTLKVGDRVAGIPLVPCMQCEDCQKGNYSLCKHYSFIGSREFGSYAEYVAVPERNAVKFDDEVSFEKGAFFEPATVALHGLRRVDYKGGKNVAILGGGTIGLMTAQWAKIFGAKSVTVFDILDERLELAKKLGCDYGVNSGKDDFMDRVKEITDGRGFDYVYETAGNTITMKMAFKLAANKAGVCFIGTPTRDLSFTVEEWENMNRKEFTLTGSWMSYSAPFPGDEWTLTSHYFKTGELKFDESFIFKKIPLSEIASAFEMFKTPGTVKGKILIDSEK
ncbi:MAG: galactitol-1-phosphate 5-dehydrogenase [Lachnospiraceae bacterium]|nr:galactitol-1-phosphate 5-dehydrogenase [Lachnospiraceae bacterium]